MRYLPLAAALMLAGCAGGGFAGYERAVTGGGAGLPETRAVARADVVTPPGRRELGLAVRSFVLEDGEVRELAGARCAVTAGSLDADLVTPARLVLPDLGPDAPAVRADCTDGARRGSAVAPPDFAWAASGGTAADRVLWGGGAWAGGPRTGPLAYPDLAVPLR